MRDIKDVLKEEKDNIKIITTQKSSIAYLKKITLLFKHDLCESVIIENKDDYVSDIYLTNSVTLKGNRYYMYNNINTLKKAFISRITYGENKDKYLLVVEQSMTKEEFAELINIDLVNYKQSMSIFTVFGIVILVLGLISAIGFYDKPEALVTVFFITIFWSLISFVIGAISSSIFKSSSQIQSIKKDLLKDLEELK